QRYGGNTACVEVRCGDELLILDGGSGMIGLGRHLMQELKGAPLDAKLFLSHTHWDHTMGIPFFLPVYKSEGQLTVYGIAGMGEVLKSFFEGAEAGEHFPVPFGKPKVNIEFKELLETTQVGEAAVSYYYLNHPGLTVGFRVEYQGKSLVYVTDNEPYRSTNQELIRGDDDESYLARIDREVAAFAHSADLLIADATYSDDEYADVVGMGHSSVGDAMRIAISAQAKRLVLFHHHPLRSDQQIDDIAQSCRARLTRLNSKLEILTPTEGDRVSL
ncbi:MBL fold metallo-hydrolase, partial [bacterium]|nr:MBL fold metallo-hydrolase [bacterium]